MLIETRGANANHDEEKLKIFLEKQMNCGNILDGTIASEPSKINVRQQCIKCWLFIVKLRFRSCGNFEKKYQAH